MSEEEIWWKVGKDLMASRGYVSNETGERVPLTTDDKIIYSVMLERHKWMKSRGWSHYDTQAYFAGMSGVSVKKVHTTIKKFIEHGVVEAKKGHRGKLTYVNIFPLSLYGVYKYEAKESVARNEQKPLQEGPDVVGSLVR